MASGNCHAKFNWGIFPYLDKWEVAGGPPSYYAVTVRAGKKLGLKKVFSFFRF